MTEFKPICNSSGPTTSELHLLKVGTDGALGELDSQLRFTSMGERGTIVQQDYKLLLDNKYTAPAYGDNPPGEFKDSNPTLSASFKIDEGKRLVQ